MLKKISYTLSAGSPLYPGTPAMELQSLRSMEKGDSANTTRISISGHAGTHIDLPSHFCPGGKTALELLGDHLQVAPVYCLDADIPAGQPVAASCLRGLPEDRRTAGIFVRTGMSRYRQDDPGRYAAEYPGVHPDLPLFLKDRYPLLKVFGIDTLSVSHPSRRTEGHACHRAFLCGDRPVLILEDLDLSDADLVAVPLAVHIYPWVRDRLDGVPVMVFAEHEGSTKNRGSEGRP